MESYPASAAMLTQSLTLAPRGTICADFVRPRSIGPRIVPPPTSFSLRAAPCSPSTPEPRGKYHADQQAAHKLVHRVPLRPSVFSTFAPPPSPFVNDRRSAGFICVHGPIASAFRDFTMRPVSVSGSGKCIKSGKGRGVEIRAFPAGPKHSQ